MYCPGLIIIEAEPLSVREEPPTILLPLGPWLATTLLKPFSESIGSGPSDALLSGDSFSFSERVGVERSWSCVAAELLIYLE